MKITGTAKYCDLRFIRAWIHATICMLHYHNCPFPIDLTTLTIEIKDLRERVNKVDGGGVGGTANWNKNRIELMFNAKPEGMTNIIVHELIHLGFRNFGDGTLEWTTRTLETKLKPLIHEIAQPLINNTQKVAAYIAHTKPGMGYRNKEEKDTYNPNGAWEKVGVKDKYGKAKRKKIRLERSFRELGKLETRTHSNSSV